MSERRINVCAKERASERAIDIGLVVGAVKVSCWFCNDPAVKPVMPETATLAEFAKKIFARPTA
ncbi:hypothetical protein DY000_02044900 [Brassica cretica]|uniref:Uncharacterized protein n=1 Tax=Brassica cretica TaxID=69181 RepID=A0ABQ7F4L8_BRACR|nr:hypothetical protein DY000_02044900 [Brassica cretica]